MGKCAVRQVDEVREDVALQVVDFDHRNIAGDRKALGERHAHQERSHQSGAARESDGVELRSVDPGLPERRVHDGNDVLLMGP